MEAEKKKLPKESSNADTKGGGNANSKGEPNDNGKKESKQVDDKNTGKATNANTKKKSVGKDDKDAKQQDKNESLEQEAVVALETPELQDVEDQGPVTRLCSSCNEVKRRWPPPPFVDPDPRDPTLLYPGDEDPNFQPNRGDIVIIHPGLHMGLMDLHRKLPADGFISSFEGSSDFAFALGDLVLRVGAYDEIKPPEEPVKKGKGNKNPTKTGVDAKKKGVEDIKLKPDEKSKNAVTKKAENDKATGQKDAKEEILEQGQTQPEPQPYHPYQKLELYTCSGFVSIEEERQLELERNAAAQAEKERLEKESAKKGSKGKNAKTVKGSKDGNEKNAKGKANDGKKDEKSVASTTSNTKGKEKKIASESGSEKSPEKDPPTGEPLAAEVNSVSQRPKPKWRYLGSQLQLDDRSQILLSSQCQGLTYFYRRYTQAGTMCDIHSVAPVLGEILINLGWLNNWYHNLEKWQKEDNKFKSLVKWCDPKSPTKDEWIPGMILLRPMVGREAGKWPGWGIDGRIQTPPPLPASPWEGDEKDDKPEEAQSENEATMPPPKCDCHRKSPCPKPPCPCHMYDPCPKLPGCTCMYCNPLPKRVKKVIIEPKVEEEEVNTKGKGKGKDGKTVQKRGANDKHEETREKDRKDKKNRPDEQSKAKDGKLKKDGNQPKEKMASPKAKSKDGKVGNSDNSEIEQEIPPKPFNWGKIEMYLFHGPEEGWEFWGRSNRICDTPHPLPNETAKPKFLHVDDRRTTYLNEEVVLDEKELNESEVKPDDNKKKSEEKNIKQIQGTKVEEK